MKFYIDTVANTLNCDNDGAIIEMTLFSRAGFEALSQLWVKVGWNEKYVYTFTWMGRPIIQIPEDVMRIQEVIYGLRPDVIIETGVAHGGSLMFFASLCKLLDHGRVIGVDIEIRPHNRTAISEHTLAPYVTLIEGDSTSPSTVQAVKALVKATETVFVFLDSNHSKRHVFGELESYHDLVSRGSYIVVADGLMKDLYDVPRGKPEWEGDNPSIAIDKFTRIHSDFVIEQPKWLFNESQLDRNITHWPNAWLKRTG